MTRKRFKLDDFDSEVEMWELLNIQAEVISDLEKENEQLRKENKLLIQGIKDTAKQGADTIAAVWGSKNSPKTMKRGYYD